MMTARFFSGASLFALLIVDICCLPVNKKGFNPGAGSNSGPTKGVAQPSHPAAPQPGASVPQPAAHSGPAPSVGSGSASGPSFSGYRDASVGPNPAVSTAALQPAPHNFKWFVAPPSFPSEREEMPTAVRAVASSKPQHVSPPRPVYQAGELSHYEHNFEHGNYEGETEELGSLPPPPPPYAMDEEPTPEGYTSEPRPDPNMGAGYWLPYPYDMMFLTGQYPPGTYTHSSSSYEQGRDHWQDDHYVRYHDPYSGPAQQMVIPTGDSAALESYEDPNTPVMAGYGQGGSYGGFGQPGHSQAVGHSVKGGY
ncbi:translation initiation factor IF-2-like [Plectropomus leopardus]|uniref:translation initiation factor IF-2-like n=1 Tax=Plectropomus leopardus TaxID=160734 RepID=UPI001C4B6F5F|nr:translation initiation factor IF-2-like [Plectropomus leopardus]